MVARYLQVFYHITFRKYGMPLPGKDKTHLHPVVRMGIRDILAIENNLSVYGDSFSTLALLFDLHIYYEP